MLKYDVVVIGGGHAGCEAAHAAARLGAQTAMVLPSAGSVARMSCNPAVGGLAKGHLVREIDALGGLMGQVTDEAGIQFRLLNRSRGPAVQAPRAQTDKALYHEVMLRRLRATPNLELVEAMASDLVVSGTAHPRVEGVRLADGRTLQCRAIVLTTGTFLRGRIHIGEESFPAGRLGEAPAIDLAVGLERLGFLMGRLKTGTPPRLLAGSIDLSRFEVQEGDAEPVPFSFSTDRIERPQAVCHIAYTSEATHAVIRERLHESPMYRQGAGRLRSVGPRYCPSVEDKVVRFADRTRHQIFIEPEGLKTDEIYLNGLSTSLSRETQRRLIDSIEGLAGATILRPGYAIEYDFVQSTELTHALESLRVEGLFLSGQINGTTGYEEAAALGIIGGINAAAKVCGVEPLVLQRHEAYIGVLVNDLVSRGIDEPYRMFTSRAEHRLMLGIESADERLTPVGRRLGLVGEDAWARFERKSRRLGRYAAWLKGSGAGGSRETALARPDQTTRTVEASAREAPPVELTSSERAAIEGKVKYRGYVAQRQREIARVSRETQRRIPPGFQYAAVSGLSREIVEKLSSRRPMTLGQAASLRGVTPAAVALLRVYLERASNGPGGADAGAQLQDPAGG